MDRIYSRTKLLQKLLKYLGSKYILTEVGRNVECFIQTKQEGWERLIHGMRRFNEAYGEHKKSSSPKLDTTLDN